GNPRVAYSGGTMTKVQPRILLAGFLCIAAPLEAQDDWLLSARGPDGDRFYSRATMSWTAAGTVIVWEKATYRTGEYASSIDQAEYDCAGAKVYHSMRMRILSFVLYD